MSRLNKVLGNKERAIREEASLKKRKPEKKRTIPVYDTRGRTITPEKMAKDKRRNIILIVVAAALVFVYVPGLFMGDKTSSGPVVSPDGEAIKMNNAVIRRYTEEDFDGDGMINFDEESYETNLWNPDSDGDGAYDSYEINVSKTDPNVYDEDILVDLQTKSDTNNEKNMGSPYSIGNVTLWASDYHSKAHGSVIETMRGYRFSDFTGYASFPVEKGRYAYELSSDGVRTMLPYRSDENAWKISPNSTIELYQQRLEEIVEVNLVVKKFYLHNSKLTEILALILPDDGLITAEKKMRIDVEPDTSSDVTAEITKPTYDSSDDYRFTRNTNTLQELLTVRKAIETEGSCVAVSFYNANYGEYIGLVYGYTATGNLLIADMNSLQPIGTLNITELAKKIVDQNGQMLSMGYFEFDGLGFHSRAGDRICFFQISNGTSRMEIAQSEKEEAAPEEDMDAMLDELQKIKENGETQTAEPTPEATAEEKAAEQEKTAQEIDQKIAEEQAREQALQSETAPADAATPAPTTAPAPPADAAATSTESGA